MRVLIVTNMWPSDGRPHWGTFVRSQVESLRALDVETTVYEIQGWRGTHAYARALRELPVLADRCKAQLVHAHYGYSGAACARASLPLVVSFCGDDLLGRPAANGRLTLKSRALIPVSKWVARRATWVIVKSEEMRRAVEELRNVDVIPNGVDMAAFAPEDRDAARDRLGWPRGVKIILFAANPEEPRKNVALARRVVTALQAQQIDVRLEIVFGQPQHVVAVAMNAADVLLLPSLHEGSPNVVKEAMCCNLPVVAAPVGDCAERLVGCIPSAIVPRTVEAFAQATREILSTRARSNGRIKVAPLTLENVALRVRAIYARLLRESGA